MSGAHSFEHDLGAGALLELQILENSDHPEQEYQAHRSLGRNPSDQKHPTTFCRIGDLDTGAAVPTDGVVSAVGSMFDKLVAHMKRSILLMNH